MTDKLFDSYISDKLKNYESPLPEGLWEKIDANKKRQPKGFWWWSNRFLFWGILFLLSSSGYFLLKKNGNNINKNIADKASLNDAIFDTKKEGNSNENNATKDKINAINYFENKNSNLIIANKETTQTNKKNSEFEYKNETVNSTPRASNFSKYKKVVLVSLSKPFTNYSSGNTLLNNKMNSDNNIENNRNSILKNRNYSNLITAQNSNFSKQYFDINSNLSSFNTNVFGNTIGREFNLYKSHNSSIAITSSLSKLFSGTDDCPTATDIRRNDLYIEGYASPDFASKSISSTTAGNESYLQKKDSSETMRLGFTIGARFSRAITNNLLLKAGLQYSQFNERLILRTENERKQIIVISAHIITRPNKPDTTIYDTTTSLQIGYRVRSNIIRYKNIEVPILLTYELSQLENKWKLAITGGAIVNIASWYQGKTFDSNLIFVNTGNKSNTGFYQHKIGVSLYGSISFIRNINAIVDVFAEPYFRYGLNNDLQSSGGFTQKINLFGVQFGTRIKINKNKHL